MVSNATVRSTYITLGVLLATAAMAWAGNVEVIVNPTLYATGEITDSLNQYLDDLQHQGYTPTLTTTSFADAEALRNHLIARYNTDGLAGALFVGDLPVAKYEQDYGGHQEWPCDFFYMDLDNTYTDADADGRYDGLDYDLAGTEIYVGRLTPSPLLGLHPGKTQADLVNEYLAKNHAYRTNRLRVAPDGLTYIDDDYAWRADAFAAEHAAGITGTMTLVKDNDTTSDHDYEARLSSTEYESIYLVAHGDSGHHAFDQPFEDWNQPSDYNWTKHDELAGLDPKFLFMLAASCYNSNYQAAYMGGEYIFCGNYSLSVIGMTKAGAMVHSLGAYYDSVGAGNTIGQAFMDRWNYMDENYIDGISESVIMYDYGDIISGDPFLVAQAYLPTDGDCDWDGDVDNVDFGSLYGNFTGPGTFDKDWYDGDFDGDGDVDNVDFGTLYGAFTGPQASGMNVQETPEPMMLMLLGLGGASLLRRPRHK